MQTYRFNTNHPVLKVLKLTPRQGTPMRVHKRPPEPRFAPLRSVFKISCLFLRPRPWQFEIWESTDKQATHLLLGFETLNLKFCDLKLWKLTVPGFAPPWFERLRSKREPPGRGRWSVPERENDCSYERDITCFVCSCQRVWQDKLVEKQVRRGGDLSKSGLSREHCRHSINQCYW